MLPPLPRELLSVESPAFRTTFDPVEAPEVPPDISTLPAPPTTPSPDLKTTLPEEDPNDDPDDRTISPVVPIADADDM
jgi:hypothetical protein